MQGSNLFEYAVIRFVPRPEREEFLNVGVILFCPSQKFLHMKYAVDENRVRAFYEKTDVEELTKFLEAFKEVYCDHSNDSAIAYRIIARRFRWLTATRSTIEQSSQVHPRFCGDPIERLEKLPEQLVEL